MPKDTKKQFGKIKIWEIVADAKDSEAARNSVRAFKKKDFPKPTGPRITKHINPDGKPVSVRIEWDYLYNKNNHPSGFSCLVFPT